MDLYNNIFYLFIEDFKILIENDPNTLNKFMEDYIKYGEIYIFKFTDNSTILRKIISYTY